MISASVLLIVVFLAVVMLLLIMTASVAIPSSPNTMEIEQKQSMDEELVNIIKTELSNSGMGVDTRNLKGPLPPCTFSIQPLVRGSFSVFFLRLS